MLNVHNHHAETGGFEVFYFGVSEVLRAFGHHVATFERDNATILTAFQKLSAFGSAIYSPASRRDFEATLRDERIDLVHLNNIWPLVSPSVIDACRDAGVPVVMSMQDYKLTCPAGQHLRHGKICEKCMGGREYWAAVHGCRNGRIWSTAYSVRNVVNRLRGPFHDGVTLYLPCTRFVADHLVRGGYEAAKMHVVPDFTDLPDECECDVGGRSPGEYVGYVGRISPEKGLPVLIEASRRTGIPVKIAGNHARMPELLQDLPPQVEFVGKLSREELPDFYRKARFNVVPSVWYECFGIVSAEAQGYGNPVIASRIGGLPEVVADGVTGLLVTPGDPADLAAAMRRIWDDAELRQRMSVAARERARREFTPGVFYGRLAAAYRRAIDLHRAAVAT